MKKYIVLVFILIIIFIGFILFKNETVFKNTYLNKVLIPKYSYFVNVSELSLVDKYSCCDTSIELLSFKNKKKLEEFRNNYIENLESCYDEGYFYDSKYNITYNKYDIEKYLFFNKIKITFSDKNMCEDEFVLRDNWIDVFKESEVINYNFNYEVLIEKIENSSRLELNEILEFDDTYQVGYLEGTLYFIDYTDNVIGIILLDANDAKKYAIYDINQDSELFLESLK